MTQLLASADRAPATYTAEFNLGPAARGCVLNVNYTAEGGASSTLDYKLQSWDAAEGAWDDLPGAAGTQMTGVGEHRVVFAPGITAAAGPPITAISIALPDHLRAAFIVGTTNVTFSAEVERLK